VPVALTVPRLGLSVRILQHMYGQFGALGNTVAVCNINKYVDKDIETSGKVSLT
jgi:hypothetical protein